MEETRGDFKNKIAILEERNISLSAQLEREKELAKESKARISQKETEIGKYFEERQNSESLCLRLHQDILALQEQKSSLQSQFKDANAEYEAHRLGFQAKEAEYLHEINQLRIALDVRARNELEMVERHEQEQSENLSQIESLQVRLADLEKEHNNFPLNCFEHEQEIHRLRAHVHQLQEENEVIRTRMVTLSVRYDDGDLAGVLHLKLFAPKFIYR